MKSFAIAIILGLCIGWVVSLAIGSSGGEATADTSGRRPTLPDRQGISAPPATRAISALSLNNQRTEARAGRPFNPYRDGLVSRDLLASLSVEQLIEAFRAGQIISSEDIRSALERIAELDPKRALTVLEELNFGASDYETAQKTILKTWARLDPEGLLSHIRSIPPGGEQADFAYDLAREWMSADPEAAMSHLAEFQNFTSMWKNRVTDDLLFAWAKKDIEAAERWIETKADPEQREELRDKLTVGHMRNLGGGDAIQFIRERPENDSLQGKLTNAYKSWGRTDTKEALKDIATQPKGDPAWGVVEDIGGEAMTNNLLMGGDLNEVIAMKDLMPGGKARRNFLLGAIKRASSNDIEAAKKIFPHIPESEQREDAMSWFTESYMRKDHVALSEWLTKLKPSQSRDSAVGSFVRLLGKSDPESARTWAETISDEKQRVSVMQELGESP